MEILLVLIILLRMFLMIKKRSVLLIFAKELFEGGNVERGGAVKNAIERGLLPSASNETALNSVNISISEKDDTETTEN